MAADPAVGRADAGAARISSPEAQAAQRMFERHGDRVLAYCRRRLGSAEEAEDALQTTFLYACRGLGRGVVPVTEVAWLLKIAHNVCLSHWDADRRRRRLELVRDPERLDASTPAAAGGREELLALESALADLTDQQRRAIVLREWRGLSYQEIAEELGLSRAAVETLIFRARRALAGGLERQEIAVGTRARVARALDLGGLLASLKSALGGGAAAKVAATGLVVGATALLGGSAPETPSRAAPQSRPPPAAVRPAEPSVAPDPAVAPAARAAATAKPRKPSRPAAEAKQPGPAKKTKRATRASADPSPSSSQEPALGEKVGQVTTGVASTVDGAVDTAAGTAEGAVETVTRTVDDTVAVVPKVVDPTVEVVGGVLGGDSLLP